MNILVITFPLFSHVEIANLISKYLKHRQTDVTYVVSENLEMLIKNPGCGKIVYQSYFRDFLYLKSSKKSFFEKKIYEFDNVLKQIYIKMVSFQPDLIIYDYESFWGKMFASTQNKDHSKQAGNGGTNHKNCDDYSAKILSLRPLFDLLGGSRDNDAPD